jgi:hypothetical protein
MKNIYKTIALLLLIASTVFSTENVSILTSSNPTARVSFGVGKVQDALNKVVLTGTFTAK